MADEDTLPTGVNEFRTVIATGPQANPMQMFLLENFTMWTLPFVFMLLELSLCILIVTPMPQYFRRGLLHTVIRVWNQYPRFRLMYKTAIGFVCYLFFDSLRRIYVVNLRIETGQVKDFSALYASERNAYLCGLTVFLFLMLLRVEAMLGYIDTLELKVAAWEKSHPGTVIEAETRPAEKKSVNDVEHEERLVAKGWVKPEEELNAGEIKAASLPEDASRPRQRLQKIIL